MHSRKTLIGVALFPLRRQWLRLKWRVVRDALAHYRVIVIIYELPPLTGEGIWQLILIFPALLGLSLGYFFLSPKKQEYGSGIISIILGLGITLWSILGGPGLAGLTAFLPLILLVALGAYLYNISKKGLSALVVVAGVLFSFALFAWMLWSGFIL